MHTDKLRPFILNRRVHLDMLRPILTRAGDPYGPLYLQLHRYIYGDTTARYTCNDTTARDRCGRNSCNTGMDPDENGLWISDKKPSRMRERMCTHTIRRTCRCALTLQHTHPHTYMPHIYGVYVYRLSLARERASSHPCELRSASVLAPAWLVLVCFVDPHKKKSTAAVLLTVLAIMCRAHHHMYAPPSVRPSRFFPIAASKFPRARNAQRLAPIHWECIS
jgi:hypothetical protein